MLVSSTVRKCFGSMCLASLFLASSLPVFASGESPKATEPIPSKPLITASSPVLNETSCALIHKKVSENPEPIKTDNKVGSEQVSVATETSASNKKSSVAASEKKSQASSQVAVNAQSKKETQSVQSKTNTVKVAQTSKPSKQQVSRSKSSSLVENALSLQGVPYVFGGTTRKGFDCSGYTQYVFKGSGVSLPRTSQAQFNVGSSVKKDQLKSGDLVFFSTYTKGASHVGIYIGGGKFVHAANSGVRTSSLNEGYYSSRYLGARRVK